MPVLPGLYCYCDKVQLPINRGYYLRLMPRYNSSKIYLIILLPDIAAIIEIIILLWGLKSTYLSNLVALLLISTAVASKISITISSFIVTGQPRHMVFRI